MRDAAEIQANIEALKQKKAQEEEVLAKVRELIAKADAMPHGNRDEERKRNSVLSHLEQSLDESKRKINGYEAEMSRERRALEKVEIRKQKAASQKVDWGQSEEFVVDEHFHAAAEEALKPLFVGNENRSKHSKGAPMSGASFAAQRKQMMLRRALEKVRAKHFAELTLEEIDLVLVCYDVLCRRITANPEDSRVMALIGKTVTETEQAIAALRERRAKLMARKLR